MATIPLPALLTADDGYLTVLAGQGATETLLRGFTSVRDVGGPSFGVKRAIGEGIIAGPRIYPSGALISQTSGHGDFRQLFELPRISTTSLSRGERLGVGAIADGVDEVMRATREQLMQGASQIKMMAGGGIASPYDPIDATQYSQEENRGGSRCRRGLGHLCRRSRLYPSCHPALHRRRGGVHRSRATDGRSNS